MPRDDITHLSDDALLVLYAQGDAGAARVLAARVLPRVFGHAHRMLGDAAEAEDVAQEAMLRLWRQAPAWRQREAQVSTWLYRVTANLCVDRLRKRRTIQTEDIADPEDPAPAVTEQMQTRAREEALQAALDQLPDRQRQAVVLRHIEGLGNPEIAAIMDISARAVESLTARGKRALTALLAGQKDELGYSDDDA